MHYLLTFTFSMITWVIFSAKFDAFHLGLGVISSILVAIFSTETLFAGKGKDHDFRFRRIPRFIGYVVWLNVQIIKANIHVFKLSITPNVKRELSPQIVTFRTKLKSDFARFVLAHSITLTPGTVTMLIEDDQYTIHAITEAVAATVPGVMEDKIAAVFES